MQFNTHTDEATTVLIDAFHDAIHLCLRTRLPPKCYQRHGQHEEQLLATALRLAYCTCEGRMQLIPVDGPGTVLHTHTHAHTHA